MRKKKVYLELVQQGYNTAINVMLTVNFLLIDGKMFTEKS